MVQTWNKFCLQGGMIEVRAQLPGAVTSASGNPDLAGGSSGRASTIAYYPTWPGIWMMGNLGRALFTASTNRMWPFSYDDCNEDVFSSSNQRISACDSSPGHGLNPNQGRGAPEIDILEGGGTAISSSIQLGPGMPSQFRTVVANKTLEGPYGYEWSVCMYTEAGCLTLGANNIDVPTATYKKRGHESWYQGLKYAANNFCASNSTIKQTYANIKASLDKGITVNKCNINVCPASSDVNGDLGLMYSGDSNSRWNINSNGTCFPVINNYMGSYLCSPDNPATACGGSGNTTVKYPFDYQMDAISSNWPIHVAAYLDYVTYQLEWVTGPTGYVRWMLDGHPIFEIPASAMVNPPQDSNNSNPIKVMIEEPMYLIINVALSSTWGATPPNSPRACRNNTATTDATTAAKNIRICDSFPMYLKVDYVRVYQDLSSSSNMSVGCDPASHPTSQWIIDHIDDYQDTDNQVVDVVGGAFCASNADCTTGLQKSVITGRCVNKRCKCDSSSFWGGPRCTKAISGSTSVSTSTKSYGPPLLASGVVALVVLLITLVAMTRARNEARVRSALKPVKDVEALERVSSLKEQPTSATSAPTAATGAGRQVSVQEGSTQVL